MLSTSSTIIPVPGLFSHLTKPDGANATAKPPVITPFDLLHRFQASSTPGVWPQIDKAQLVSDIATKLTNALSVNQGRTEFCGPAAIVFELVRRFPTNYVTICQDLYERGEIHTRSGATWRPSATLLASHIKPGITPADWLLMASLRDTANIVFPVSEKSGPFVAGLTTPGEMEQWSREILGLERTNYESTYFFGEFTAMRNAKSTLANEGVAFLLVNSSMVGNPQPVLDYPDHWIVLTSVDDINDGTWWKIDSGHIRFECVSYGRQITVDEGEGPFEDQMWGAVTAT